MSPEDFEVLRQQMLAEISAWTFRVRGTIGKPALDERVMAAMGRVPRHEFVPIELQPYAYANIPLPIGFDKTISQPFIVALMTDLLDISADDAILEIGTGLGYQAAILAQLARKVYSIEIIEELGQRAKQRLHQQGCTNIELKIANGYHGWSVHAPFDKVDSGSGLNSPAAHRSVENWRKNGNSCRPARCAAAPRRRKTQQWHGGHQGDSAGAVFAPRGHGNRPS
jgi:protein-L-isoaspartate(D-aspartate) O-methyltransferase